MIAIPTLWLAMFLFIPAPPQNPPEAAPVSPQTPAPKSTETSSPAPAPKFPLLIPSRSISPSPTPAPGASRPRRVKDDGKELRDLSSAPAPGASRPRRVNGNEPEKEPRDLPSQRVPDKWRLPLPHVSDLTPLPPPAITSSLEPAPKSAPTSPPTPAPKSASASPPAPEPKRLASSPVSTSKSSPAPTARVVKSVGLIIPVEGGRPSDLHDTFYAARSGGRVHRAIDIIVPRGTRVLAATDGEIVRIGRNRLGGKIIYQLSGDKKLVFYYAHLDRYSDDLRVGDYVRQGDVIAYVGCTGNAGPGNYHLHFSILIAGADPKKLWKGNSINPYPILRRTK
jgi:peptidoglycan LD-endopeptidase LytH